MEEIRENWALPVEKIEAYLQGLDRARRTGEAGYEIDGCRLSLQPLAESRVGRWSFPRTLVTFSGEEEAVERFRQQFRVQFLTLGG